MTSMTSALTVDSLSFSYGKKPALNRVSFGIEPGDFTVLLGQNGAGKSTLFSLITRLYNPHSGSVRIFGHDIRTHSAAALKQLGVVFQQRTLDMDLTVQQNLLYFTALHGINSTHAKQRSTQELSRLGLEEHRHEKIRQLSGGQMRRVEIVRALLHQPQLMILDEPTVGLDLISRQTILEHVRKLCEQEQLALLWATHLIDEVLPTDRVVILHKGEVIANGRAQEIVEQSGTQDIREAFQKLTRPRKKPAAS
jgi:ABC-2 type transport system ATP-binding protein